MHLFLFLQCEEGGDHGGQHVVEDTPLKGAVFMRRGVCQTMGDSAENGGS